jgi:DUF1680 family protein
LYSGQQPATVNIRIPQWAVAERSSLTLNGVSLANGKPLLPGKFLAVTRRFAKGDTIAGSFGMEARLEPINDNRTECLLCLY